MSGVVGFPVTGMLAFDQVIIDLMNAYAVPGAALAVSRNGTVVIERGYGLLDLNDPDSQATAANSFRIASVSKPITAMGILKLIEQNGPLKLNSLVWDLLKEDFPLLPGKSLALGVDQIRILHLLQHSAGWDYSVYDPMFDVDTDESTSPQHPSPAPHHRPELRSRLGWRRRLTSARSFARCGRSLSSTHRASSSLTQTSTIACWGA